MVKKNELKFKKEVVSKLQAKQINGGGNDHTRVYICNVLSSFREECIWSQGIDDFEANCGEFTC